MTDASYLVGQLGKAKLMAEQARISSEATASKRRLNEIDTTAQDFESMFLHQVLEDLFAGVDTEGYFGGGYAEQVYRSYLLDEYSKLIAQSGGVGIADHVKREMIKIQESQHEHPGIGITAGY